MATNITIKNKILFLIIFLFCFISNNNLNAQSTNIRGYYLKDLNGWLGDSTQENTILRYAQNNNLNYIIMYDLGSFDFRSTSNKNKLAFFIRKAKTQYGLFQIAASGEIYQFFKDNIIPYNQSRFSQLERFDVFNFEFEYWVTTDGIHVSPYYITRYLTPNGYYNNDTADAWRFSWNEFKQIDSSARMNNALSEYYLGWANKGQMQQIVARSGRILLHAYRPTDSDIYSYSKTRLRYAGSLNQYATIVTIFSSETSFMNAWLNSGNSITKPYQTYTFGPNTNYNYFDSDTGNWKQYINLQGYVWFTYNTNPHTSALASITSDGPTTFCIGGSVTLQANVGSQYLWSPGGQTTRSITVNQAGNYSVRVTNFSGQNATSQTVRVTITTSIPNPTIYVNGPTTICNGGSVVLTASAADSVRWSNGAITPSITVNQSGNYSVIAYAGGGCMATSSITHISVVSSMPTPSIIASGPSGICYGVPIQLTSSLANGYLWNNGQTTRSIIVTQPGIYYVNAYGGPNCYSQSNNFTVSTIQQTSTPTITANGSTYLSGTHTSVVLTSSYVNSGNYIWSNGATTRSITVNVQGNYRVTTTANGMCPSTSTSTIVSNISCTPPATPTITLNGSNILMQNHNSVNLTSSVGGGYYWSNGMTTRTITAYNAGAYFVRVYNAGNCYSTSLQTNVYSFYNPISVGTFPVELSYNDKQYKIENKFSDNFILYPNPSIGKFTINFDYKERSVLRYNIVDLYGKILDQNKLSVESGKNIFEFEIKNPGVYFMYIFGNNEKIVVKIIIKN
jgi:hypothetical protein